MAMQEQAHHIEAFEWYYAQGKDRGYRGVAQQFGVSLTSVTNWARNFNWQKRIEQRDMTIAKELEKKTVQTVVNQKANYRKILHSMIANMVKEMQKGFDPKTGRPLGHFPQIETMKDLETVVKLDLLLMGENTDQVKVEGEVKDRPIVEQSIDEWLRGDTDARNAVRDLFRKRMASGSGTSPSP